MLLKRGNIKKEYPYYTVRRIETLRDLILENDTQYPDKTAFSYRNDGELVYKTYGDFAREVVSIGEWFTQEPAGKHIGIVGENSYEWLLVYFAVVCSGNIAVPIDANLPTETIQLLIEQSECDIAFFSNAKKDITCKQQQGSEERISRNYKVFFMDELPKLINWGYSEIECNHGRMKDICLRSSDIATIVFTSGTTGESKGVVLTHGNICADIIHSCEMFTISGGVVALLPFHHIFGMVVGIMMVYHYAYPVHINAGKRYIMRDIKELKPQTLMLVPLYVEAFYKQIKRKIKQQGKEEKAKRMAKIALALLRVGIDIRRKVFVELLREFGGNLELIISGGAMLDPDYVNVFHEWGIEIHNGYGISECSSVISVNRNLTNKPGSVGQVISGCEVKIDETGEILVKGENVFSNYYKDEESTRTSFADGWYHTGDLGYFEDGFLYINGRKKNLIILSNGENISPEGIEQELLKIDLISEIVVRGKGNSLEAEVFTEDSREKVRTIIEDWNKGQPPYKRIGNVVFRDDEFQKTTSKKIKR